MIILACLLVLAAVSSSSAMSEEERLQLRYESFISEHSILNFIIFHVQT